MKKKLFTLLLCAFACLSVNAQVLTLHSAAEAQAVTAAQLSGITKIVLNGNFGDGWSAVPAVLLAVPVHALITTIAVYIIARLLGMLPKSRRLLGV